MSKAVVLLSGGLDSAVASYVANRDNDELYTLTVGYGQLHIKEVRCAKQMADRLQASWVNITVPLKDLVLSALMGRGKIPVGGIEDGRIPSTWVPQRNSLFLVLAFAYAETVGADKIYTGFNVIDYSGYPDCRPEFVKVMNEGLNLGSKRFTEVGKGFEVVAPLMQMRKSEIVQLGGRLGVPFDLTTSCYSGGEKACGLCDSCRIRLLAFKDAGLVDPIEYEQ